MKKTIAYVVGAIAVVLVLSQLVISNYKPSYMDLNTDDQSKTIITIGLIGNKYGFETGLEGIVSDYNNSQNNYQVHLRDYFKETNNAEDALKKLNTEIISGNGPDMLCFSTISPYPYISKNLLVDMEDLLEKEDLLHVDEIAISQALKSSGGLYYICGGFSFETLIAKYSQFGERNGWTIDEYLDIELNKDDQSPTIYNMTSERFLEKISSRYIRDAINWEKNECSFNDIEFLKILEASKRIQHFPENRDDTIYSSSGASNVMDGKLTASLKFVSTVKDLADEEKYVGQKMSYIGWPTVDGRCGTDVYLYNPLGILADTANIDACWEFIKYSIINYTDSRYLPVYLPTLEQQLADAQEKEENENPITQNDAERFLELVSAIENVALYDTTVLEIIMKESAAYFEGNKTAEQVAELIQSKVSIYLAEQS